MNFLMGFAPCVSNELCVKYLIVVLALCVSSCSTFTHYAYLLDITSLVFLNVVGTALNVLYVYMYLAVVRQKVRAHYFLYT